MSAPGLAGWGLAALAVLVFRAELRRRAELVARACHELRGPLTAAHLALHAARREPGAAAQRLAAVEEGLRGAGRLVADLADAGRGVPLATVRTREEQIHLDVLLARQVDGWRALAAAHGCEVQLGDMVPGTIVCGDPVRLAQATSNLVANAIEHGRGTVVVRAVLSGDCARIEVSDDGPGLPAAVSELARRPRAGRGARGRGLAIASQIAVSHGGRIAAAPSPRGARVAIELPPLRRSAA